MRCDDDIKQILCSNIILAGGNSMFPGLQERLAAELMYLVPIQKNLMRYGELRTASYIYYLMKSSSKSSPKKVKVIAPPERKYCAWIGASTVASLKRFEKMWISKEEYDSYGEKIVSRKCF